MSDYHNLQEENRRLAAEIERLKAELADAKSPKLRVPESGETDTPYHD
jgi:cell division septum initiation protein DivIVA